MTQQRIECWRYLLVWACCCGPNHPPAIAESAAGSSPIGIGTRVEMFVDDRLIDPALTQAVTHELQTPIRREIVLTMDQPWEGIASAYFTVFQDGARYRMYYRGSVPGEDHSENQVTCYAESADGIHFERPNLGLHEYGGTKENNIILRGVSSHNFAPFLDGNPAAKPEERYKALAGLGGELFAYSSADGIHWNKLQAAPVITSGTFDSLNVGFWDETEQCYRAYSRYFGEGGVFRRPLDSTQPFTGFYPLDSAGAQSLRRRSATRTFLHECCWAMSRGAAPSTCVPDALRPGPDKGS